MQELSEILQHAGVKGMKWGVRRDPSSRRRQRDYNKGMRLIDRSRLKKMTSNEARKKYLDDKDKAWIENTTNDKNIRKVSRQVAKEFKKVNSVMKERFGGKGVKGAIERSIMPSTTVEYNRAIKKAYDEILADKTHSIYKLSPTRTREVQLVSNPDGTMKVTIVERNNPKLTKQRAKLTHAETDDYVTVMDGMVFMMIPDDDGYLDKIVLPFDEDENELQHAGVIGMKWGVRRDSSRRGGADGKLDAKDKPLRTKLAKNMNSLKRERQWKTVLRRMDELSTSDITAVAKRVSLENNLKTLSRSKVGTKKDKADYLRRERMDDAELNRHVVRLRAKESLRNAVSNASKEQREFGEKVVQIGGSIGVRYALTKKLPGPKEVFDIVKKPKESFNKDKSNALQIGGVIANEYMRTGTIPGRDSDVLKKALEKINKS